MLCNPNFTPVDIPRVSCILLYPFFFSFNATLLNALVPYSCFLAPFCIFLHIGPYFVGQTQCTPPQWILNQSCDWSAQRNDCRLWYLCLVNSFLDYASSCEGVFISMEIILWSSTLVVFCALSCFFDVVKLSSKLLLLNNEPYCWFDHSEVLAFSLIGLVEFWLGFFSLITVPLTFTRICLIVWFKIFRSSVQRQNYTHTVRTVCALPPPSAGPC